jgi:glucokinase
MNSNSSKTAAKAPQTLLVKRGLVTGLDVGGTKVHILDSETTNLHRYATADYPDLYAVLDDYFLKSGTRPEKIVAAIAGPRDEKTGDVQFTTVPWPTFKPREAERRYPGTTFATRHDMGAVAAGMVYVPGLDLIELKAGKPAEYGPKIAITISTGVGLCVAIWDAERSGYLFFSGESGHMGFQPYTEAEHRHLAHIFTKYDHPSIELAISGKYGMEHWIEHSPELKRAAQLDKALQTVRAAGQPIGAVLLEFAKHSQGPDQVAAAAILGHMGGLVGNVLADYALIYRSTGGIYLTGSVALGLGEYWAEHTPFLKAFARHGTADHAPWIDEMLGAMPIYLMSDPNIGVAGALALAKRQ